MPKHPQATFIVPKEDTHTRLNFAGIFTRNGALGAMHAACESLMQSFFEVISDLHEMCG